MEMGRNSIRIDPADNVAVALLEIREGEVLVCAGCKGVNARETIRKNHKVAVAEIPAGEAVIKYGEAIGRAARAVKAGEWVHTHNLKPEDG